MIELAIRCCSNGSRAIAATANGQLHHSDAVPHDDGPYLMMLLLLRFRYWVDSITAVGEFEWNTGDALGCMLWIADVHRLEVGTTLRLLSVVFHLQIGVIVECLRHWALM